MKKCTYSFEGKTLTESELIQAVLEKLQSGNFQNLATTIFSINPLRELLIKLDNIKRISEGKSFSVDYIGVSRWLDNPWKLDGPDSAPRLLAPAYDEANRIAEYISDQIGADKNAEMAEKEILALIEDEKIGAGLGTLIHKFIELGFIYGIDSTEYRDYLLNGASVDLNKPVKGTTRSIFDLVTSEGAASNLTSEGVINILEKTASKIISDIKGQYGEDALYYPEFEMITDKAKVPNTEKGIVGKADLIVITKSGELIIYDFKTSSRLFDDWFAAKTYHTDYQLGVYRLILKANDIDVAKAKLIVKPILFDRKNIASLLSPNGGLIVEEDKNRTGSMIHGAMHLDYQLGTFTKNIEELIPVTTTFNPSKEINEIQEAIDKDLSLILPAYNRVKDIDRDYIINNRIQSYITSEGKTKYKFYDEFKDTWIYKEDKEEFVKEGGYIDKYIETARSFYSQRTINLIDIIKTALNKGTLPQNVDFIGGKHSSNPKIPIALQNVLGRYCDPTFEIIDYPALIDNNIIAFERKGSGIIEFVMISANPLDKLTSVNEQSTVLGKFLGTDEARRLTGMEVLDSKYGNLELIKLMSILNTMRKEDSNFLVGKVIGPILVLNPDEGFPWTLNMNSVSLNFSFLCQQTKGELKNVISLIPLADLWEFFVRELLTIALNVKEDETLYTMLTGLTTDQVDLLDRIDALARLILKLRDFDPTLKSIDQTSTRTYDTTKPTHLVYTVAVDLYNSLHNINVTPEGSISKYGLHLSELIKIFSLPFIKDLANVTDTGERPVGFLNGLHMSSPQTVLQEVLRGVYRYYDAAYTNVRELYMRQRNRIQSITLAYMLKKHGQTYRLLYNDMSSDWEALLLKNADGTISSELLLKNPYDRKEYLSEEDRQFLKEILWEINKFQLKLPNKYLEWTYKEHSSEIDSLTKVQEAISSKKYLQLPLRRSQHFLKLKSLGSGTKISEVFSDWWKNLRDEYDPRQIHNYQAQQIRKDLDKDSLKMYNQYDLKHAERERYIEHIKNPYSFEFDLDLLASDVAFQYIRKHYFLEVLLLTETVSAAMHFLALKGGRKWDKELETLENQKKISLTNEDITGEEWHDTLKVTGALKQLNSLVVLAFRPLQFLKELTFGQITNYSRAWTLKGMSGEISAKHVFEANKVIWGQSLKKYGNAFLGEGDIADFTMCSALNKIYGFANEDLNRLVDNSTLSSTGITTNFSKWMFIANSAPDYFNRLTLFIAKMMQDGCWEAHTLDKNGDLIYDFTKDKRFSKLHKFGLNSNSTDKEYLELKGLYYAMIEDFEKDGIKGLKKWNSKMQSFDLVSLPRAYTTKQRNAIKEVADLAYGFYDHEAKSLIDHKAFGLIFKLFMTFWTAKTTLWFRGRPKTLGDNTSQGRYIPATKDGKTLYRRYVIDPNTNKLITVQLVTEDEMTPDEIDKLEVQYQWQGDYIEGIVYSIGGALYDIFHADWKHLKEDKAQLANLKLALHDILVGLLLFTLLKWIFSAGTGKIKDVHPTGRVLLRAMQDVSPTSITSLNWEPGFVSTIENFKTDGIKLFSTDPEFSKFINNRIGAFKDFYYDEL